ncbi:hypothetical protein DSO57_1020180 [Entomophthora muscae]|uniref:Uncharacterized protein n=1 Tax=Entomophthora muscae TaxID=34485 RepID=A0ACC2RUU4_9FUNG|nr:hypothetical protein DSO57_1020180 [Entomophthora muscae]
MLASASDYPCRRPIKGVAGVSNNALANYFPVELQGLESIYHFDVSITPEVPKQINIAVFDQFEEQFFNDRSVFNNTCMVYDGVKSSFSPSPMGFGKTFSTEIELLDHALGNKKAQSSNKFLLKFREVKKIRVSIEDMYAENSAGLASIMALNVLFIYSLKSKFFNFDNSFYTLNGARPMSGGLEVWPGFSRTLAAVQDGLVLNVDTAFCVFYRSGSLLDLLVSFLGLRKSDELRDPRFWQHIRRVLSFLKNLRIVFKYRNIPSRGFKIRGLSESGANSTHFVLSEEGIEDRQVTVQEYFARKFGIHLEFPSLPCIEVKRGNLIPMELCQVVSGQRYSKKLNDGQTAEMIKIACMSPNVRSEKISQSLHLMDLNDSLYLKQFGVHVVPNLKKIDTRILPVPRVLYHPSSRNNAFQPMDGAWNLRDKKVFEGRELHTWAVIAFVSESRIRRGAIEAFMNEFVSTCVATGVHISNRKPKIYYALPPQIDNVSRFLFDIYVATGNDAQMRPQLLLCILPDKGAALYGTIKTVCEVEIGIPTQCIQADKVMRPNKQYCANVCLKMNAKLGGVNVSMQECDLVELKEPPTLLLGAHLSKMPTVNGNSHSISAVIGSLDFAACRYSSEIGYQTFGDEFISNLQEMVVNLLRRYYKSSQSKPQQIIYFRDGVSSGQFRNILTHEMRAIKQACRSLEDGYNPHVTFVVLQKRHNTRLFPTNKDAMDRSGNCKAGTLVETSICHPYNFDFFLQSHSGLQGTSRPIHYYVLVDEIRFSSDRLQKLCYNLCYLFNRATRSVSLVPPIYYAHLASARASCHLKSQELSGNNANATQSVTSRVENISLPQELSNVMYYI